MSSAAELCEYFVIDLGVRDLWAYFEASAAGRYVGR
jgi:hypothetical protein